MYIKSFDHDFAYDDDVVAGSPFGAFLPQARCRRARVQRDSTEAFTGFLRYVIESVALDALCPGFIEREQNLNEINL